MSAITEPTAIDRLGNALRVLIRGEDPLRSFSRVYEYAVQATDGTTVTASLTDTSFKVPSVVQIPMRFGVPGALAKPKVGSKCYVTWANADPSRPVCVGYDSASSQTTTFDGGTGTSEHVATIEGVINLLSNLLIQLGISSAPGGASGAAALASALVALTTPATSQLYLANVTSACSTPATNVISASMLTSIGTALTAKRTAGGDAGGAAPNLGCANIKSG